MPYVPDEDRPRLNKYAIPLALNVNTIGELTYCFYVLARIYITLKGKSYTTLASVLGALDSTSQELYRRIVAPYEDRKREENGDV